MKPVAISLSEAGKLYGRHRYTSMIHYLDDIQNEYETIYSSPQSDIIIIGVGKNKDVYSGSRYYKAKRNKHED